MLLHASAAARGTDAVLVLGPSGSGKSDLVLRLLHEGWSFVGDDQLEVTARDGALHAAPPQTLRGMLEVRGLGLFEGLAVTAAAHLRLAVHLVPRRSVPRLPAPQPWQHQGCTLPAIALDPFEASATAKLDWALSAALGQRRQRAGAFA